MPVRGRCYRYSLTTYIPGRTITDSFGRIYNANGNGRGSTPFDYKTRQTARVETDRRISPSGKLGEPTGLVGITQRLDKNGKEIDRAKEPDSAVKQVLDARKTVRSEITCTGGSCSATGAHDGFPGAMFRLCKANGARVIPVVLLPAISTAAPC